MKAIDFGITTVTASSLMATRFAKWIFGTGQCL